ncbi:MAG TPA: hypothetical protein VLI05_01950 [Candidatus Saccharimonadia bacterium]|nr:hypothetical protein [Candidatus Saccharimonadia bacterium]
MNGPRNWLRLGALASGVSAIIATETHSTWMAMATLALMLVSLPGLVVTVPNTGDRTKDLAVHFLGHWAGRVVDGDRAFQAWMDRRGNEYRDYLLRKLAAQQVQTRAASERFRAQLRDLNKP